jgi:hypothetical protein
MLNFQVVVLTVRCSELPRITNKALESHGQKLFSFPMHEVHDFLVTLQKKYIREQRKKLWRSDFSL